MSDLQLLFVVLVCLYVWECACWLPRGSVGFLTWLRWRWKIVHPGATFIGNQKGGFIFAPPFPPLGCILIGTQFPLSLSPKLALAYTSLSVNPGWPAFQTQNVRRFDQVKSIKSKGKKIFIDGELFLKTQSLTYAHSLANRLRELTKMPIAQRANAIESLLRDTLDVTALKKRWAEFTALALKLPWLGNALFIYLFALTPTVIWQLGLKLSWVGLLVGLLTLTTANAVLFFRAHKALYPEMEDERFTHFLLILLSPVTSIRAQDVLSRPLLENFHPLAIACALCSPEDFRRLAQSVVLDFRFPGLPISPSREPDVESAARKTRDSLQKITETFLTKQGINPDEFVCPPQPADETCASYCPRCQAQFTTPTGSCADCGGLPLVSFTRPT
jgi:hypothetical protein